MLASVHGSKLDGVCCGGYAQLHGNQACRGGRVEGVTNRGLWGRDGSVSDQDTVIKIRTITIMCIDLIKLQRLTHFVPLKELYDAQSYDMILI